MYLGVGKGSEIRLSIIIAMYGATLLFNWTIILWYCINFGPGPVRGDWDTSKALLDGVPGPNGGLDVLGCWKRL